MRRAYLLIVVPAVIVGFFYVGVFRYMGYSLPFLQFLGAIVAFGAAVLAVRHFSKRKMPGSGSGSHGDH